MHISPIWIPLISSEVTKSKRSLWHPRFPIGFTFKSCGLGFHSAIGVCGRYAICFIILLSFLYMSIRDFVCWLEHYHLQLYYSSTLCMLHHNFLYCIFSCYISWTQPGVRCLYNWWVKSVLSILWVFRLTFNGVWQEAASFIRDFGPVGFSWLWCRRHCWRLVVMMTWQKVEWLLQGVDCGCRRVRIPPPLPCEL
jgi:hypothetical protein